MLIVSKRPKLYLTNILWSFFCFQICFTDILTDDTDRKYLQTAKHPDRYHNTCPAGNDVSVKIIHKRLDQHSQTDQTDQQTTYCDHSNRFTESEVIPSNANVIIFPSGYLLSPAKRSPLSYSTVVL